MVTESEMILTQVLGDIISMKTKKQVEDHIQGILDKFNPEVIKICETKTIGKDKWVIYWFDDVKDTEDFMDERNDEYRFGGEFLGIDVDALTDMDKDLRKKGFVVKRWGLAGTERNDLILDTLLLDIKERSYDLGITLNEFGADSIGKLDGFISMWWD